MEAVPDDLRYSRTHEWVRREGQTATIGITDHAQAELGDIVYLDLPEPGRQVDRQGKFGEVESVKAVSELFAPVGGEVLEANSAISESTEVVNEDPYGKGWLIRIEMTDAEELAGLLSPEDYRRFIEEGGH